MAKEAGRTAESWTGQARDAVESEQRQAVDKFAQTRKAVATAGEEAKEWADEVVRRTRSRGSHDLQLMRVRARQLAHEYPLQTIAASAGVAFFIGVFLRIRRSNRYE